MNQGVSRVDRRDWRLYELLAALFITTLIVSNIASVKIVSVGVFTFDAGTILFPLAYIVSDVITEVYGFRRMRRLLAIGVSMLLLTSLTFWVVGMLPPADDWSGQAAFTETLGVVGRIVLASTVAIFLGELANAYVMARRKIATKGEGLWLRLMASSLVGNIIDTAIFITIAFAGTMPFWVLVNMVITVAAMKMVIEVAVSPLTMRVIRFVKSTDKVDIYEQPKLLS